MVVRNEGGKGSLRDLGTKGLRDTKDRGPGRENCFGYSTNLFAKEIICSLRFGRSAVIIFQTMVSSIT